MEYVQLQLNYFDWDSETVQSGACYETAKRHHKPVIVMEPVKGGVLADVPQPIKALFRQKQPNLSDASWAIRFAASLDNVMMVLSGMSNPEQLEDNASYMEHFVPLDEEEKRILAEAVRIFDEHKAVDCTACGKCLSVCPEHIPIPDYFKMYNDHCRMNKNTNGMMDFTPEVEKQLALTPTEELSELNFVKKDAVVNSGAAYIAAKRTNQLRVRTAAATTWGDAGARINTISPGVIVTPLAYDEFAAAGENYQKMIEASPAKRVGTSEEIAAAAAFLLSDEASFITGTDLLIDGGVIAAIKSGRYQLNVR